MSTPASAASTTPLSTVFWTRVHRYRNLLRRRWWVLLLTCALALCVQAWRVSTQPPSYRSEGQVIIAGRASATEASGSKWQEATSDYQKTTIALLTSNKVRAQALEQIEAKRGSLVHASGVDIEARADGTVFTLFAIGSDPTFTRDLLEETMRATLDVRRGFRQEASSATAAGLREEIHRLEAELKKDDDAILAFQTKNNIVLNAKDASNESKVLQELQNKLYALRAQTDRLELLDPNGTTDLRLPELGLNGGANGGGGGGSAPASNAGGGAGGGTLGDSTDSEIRSIRNKIAQLRSDYDDLGQGLKPAHPKMRLIAADIARQEQALKDLQSQNKVSVKDSLALLRSLIARTEAEIGDTKTRALQVDRLRAELDALRTKRDRDEAHYNEYQKNLTNLNLSKEIEADPMTILQHATAPMSVQPGWMKNLLLGLLAGLGVGGGILALLDRLDDRMGAFSDFQALFSETVLGQIPRDEEARDASRDGVETFTELLRSDDERYQLVESYRNIRSSLLYMPLEGARPKTLLITSAIPNEGKSTIATNLALVMAFAGMKTLLIDGDLRRGAIHDKLNTQREPGLTDVLARSLPWTEAVRTTETENLFFLPRGKSVPQPSEYLLGATTDALLQEIYAHYDYVIMDSSPVLAADDTASLAPKMDATLFVVRLGFTSAKMTRKALEILDKRQANVPGVILNFVDTTSPEFVYYQYPEYYHAPRGEEQDEKPRPPSSVAVPSVGHTGGTNGHHRDDDSGGSNHGDDDSAVAAPNGHRPTRRGRSGAAPSPVART